MLTFNNVYVILYTNEGGNNMPKVFTCMSDDISCPYYHKLSGTCNMQFEDPNCYPPEECDECIDDKEIDED